MKKIYGFLLVVLILIGCSAGKQEDETKTYMIVDQDTNKVLNNYEYTLDGKTLLSTRSYAGDESVKKSVEYEYDDKGYLERMIIDKDGSSTKIITFETEEVYDSIGRLEKLVRTSSEGDVVETFFGYDETGELRGVVEQLNSGSVIMKDYSTD